MKVIDIWALVDSNADISCIDQDFVRKHNLSTIKLTVPIQEWNTNHCHNKMETFNIPVIYSSTSKGLPKKWHSMSWPVKNKT